MSATAAEKSRLKRLRETPEQKAHNKEVSAQWRERNKARIAEERRRQRLENPEEHQKKLESIRAKYAYSTWSPEKKAAFLADQKERHANRSEEKRKRDKAYLDQRYAAKKGEIAETSKKRWKNDPAWKAKKLAEAKRYYENNREKVQATVKAYAIKNRARLRCIKAKYRALKRAATVNLRGIQAFVMGVKSKPFARCYYCNRKVSTNGIHFDHIVPLSKGGLHAVENLCVACQPCNNSKKDKSVAEWMETRIGQQVLNL